MSQPTDWTDRDTFAAPGITDTFTDTHEVPCFLEDQETLRNVTVTVRAEGKTLTWLTLDTHGLPRATFDDIGSCVFDFFQKRSKYFTNYEGLFTVKTQ